MVCSMLTWRRAVALAALLSMTPFASELVEAGIHFLRHGDFVHSAGHDAPTDEEHGCTPLLHLCGCHSTAATDTAATSIGVGWDALAHHSAISPRHGRQQDPPPHLPPLA